MEIPTGILYLFLLMYKAIATLRLPTHTYLQVFTSYTLSHLVLKKKSYAYYIIKQAGLEEKKNNSCKK